MFASASRNPIIRLVSSVWERLRPRRRRPSDRDHGSGPCGAALGAIALLLLVASGAQATEVTFQYRPSGAAQSVTVAGSFNGWDTGANPLSDADGDGLWSGTFDLAPGRTEYKFVVDGSQWITDETAADFADDGFGGKNSLVTVGDAPITVGSPGGGANTTEAAPAAPTTPAGTVPVTFRFRPEGAASQVSVAGTFNNWDTGADPLTKRGDVWEAVVPLAPGTYQYKFVVDGTQWITDESAAAFVDDGFGGKNSVVEVADKPLVVGEAGGAAAETFPGDTPEGLYTITFRYQPVIGGVSSVSVAGSFNDWNAAANPLTDDDGDGIWETSLQLSPGDYEYKYVVDGDQWFPDDYALDTAPDGFGGENSLVSVVDRDITLGPGGDAPAKSEAPAVGLHEVTFSYRPSGTPQQVMLAGSFNDWNVGKTPMTDANGDGTYTTTLLLPAGEYQYKFVADGNWITDREHADSFTDDGFGGENSVIRVDDRFPVVKVELGDARISDAGIEHTQTATELNNMGNGRVELTFKSHRNDIQKMEVMVQTGGETSTVTAHPAGSDGAFAYWRADVTVPAGDDGFLYVPVYEDAGTKRYLTPDGFTPDVPATAAWFTFTPAEFPPFITPDWVKDAVIYQIFPDRFRNGDTGNDPDFSQWYYDGKKTLPASGKTNGEYFHLVTDWSDIAGLTRSPYRTDGKPDYFSFYGGDLAGVSQGLDYLADLGVTAIYFNPIFQAKSNHKYDCADYMKIDPAFGTNEEFRQLVQDAHARGIHVILDIVFNHCGNSHWAFKQASDEGPESAYYDWFEFKRWPLPASFEGGVKPEDYYACWWGFGDLPDLNFDLSRPNPAENAVATIDEARVNRPLFDHLMEVTAYWLGDMDADGVRLDVPNEVPPWFWVEFNRKVKSVNPDAYIVGELWGNAADWVGPTLFDATMNYAYFRDPVTKFLGQGRGSAQEFDRTLATGRNTYPTQAAQVMMNLLGSHDTVRYRQQVGGDVNRVKLSYLFGMTYVGAPHIYYGDEIAMMGGKDPDCRRPFLWGWQDDAQRKDLHDYVRALAKARAEHEALRRGDFTTVYAEGTSYAYLRTAGEERILVALNTAARTGVMELDLAALGNPTRGVDLVTGQTVDLTAPLSLPPVSGTAIVLD